MQLKLEKIGDIAVASPQAQNLDQANSPAFKEALEPVLETHTRVVLDLGQIRYIDSTGLAAVLSCLRRLNASDGDLKLCSLSRPVRTLFELARMHRLFEIFPDRDEAVRASLWSCPWKLLNIVVQPDAQILRQSREAE